MTKRLNGYTPAIDRYYARRTITETGCWELSGPGSNGYTRIMVDGRTWLAHRWAYTYFVGPIPAGYEVDHRCRNRRCSNPEHLEAVTKRENCRRWSESVTHCPKGHEYTPENTYIPKSNCKVCRECQRDAVRRYRQRKLSH